METTEGILFFSPFFGARTETGEHVIFPSLGLSLSVNFDTAVSIRDSGKFSRPNDPL